MSRTRVGRREAESHMTNELRSTLIFCLTCGRESLVNERDFKCRCSEESTQSSFVISMTLDRICIRNERIEFALHLLFVSIINQLTLSGRTMLPTEVNGMKGSLTEYFNPVTGFQRKTL